MFQSAKIRKFKAFRTIQLFMPYQLGLIVETLFQTEDCKQEGIELKQTLTVVFNPVSTNRGHSAKYQSKYVENL